MSYSNQKRLQKFQTDFTKFCQKVGLPLPKFKIKTSRNLARIVFDFQIDQIVQPVKEQKISKNKYTVQENAIFEKVSSYVLDIFESMSGNKDDGTLALSLSSSTFSSHDQEHEMGSIKTQQAKYLTSPSLSQINRNLTKQEFESKNANVYRYLLANKNYKNEQDVSSDINAVINGSVKNEAYFPPAEISKNEKFKSMLDNSFEPPSSICLPDPVQFQNDISWLNTFAQRNSLLVPKYVECKLEQTLLNVFKFKCEFDNKITFGTGKSKKMAKTQAAGEMAILVRQETSQKLESIMNENLESEIKEEIFEKDCEDKKVIIKKEILKRPANEHDPNTEINNRIALLNIEGQKSAISLSNEWFQKRHLTLPMYEIKTISSQPPKFQTIVKYNPIDNSANFQVLDSEIFSSKKQSKTDAAEKLVENLRKLM